MKALLLIILLYSCSSHRSVKEKQPLDMVSLGSAIDHAYASYLKGCVDTYHQLNIPKSFNLCVERAKAHRLEIEQIVSQDPVPTRQ